MRDLGQLGKPVPRGEATVGERARRIGDRHAMQREGLSIVYSLGFGRKGKGEGEGGRGGEEPGQQPPLPNRKLGLEEEGRSPCLDPLALEKGESGQGLSFKETEQTITGTPPSPYFNLNQVSLLPLSLFQHKPGFQH